MRTRLGLGVCIALWAVAVPAAAEQQVGVYAWSTELVAPPGTGVVVTDGSGSESLLAVVGEGGAPVVVPLLVIDAPAIESARYALVGRVAYEGVEEASYLELWSIFADGRRYFTRTLGSGAMGPLLGSSDWREVLLPFDATGAGAPVRLELNLVLGGRGRVQLAPFGLVAYGDAPAPRPPRPPRPPPAPPRPRARAGQRRGAISGAVMGLLGALVGGLVWRGRARRFVVGLLTGLTVLGGALVVAGIVAVADEQPYAVCFTLLMLGGLSLVIMGVTLVSARRRYEAIELRRLTALDAR
jgi:hypothetical protein